jgi:hypothetical protein
LSLAFSWTDKPWFLTEGKFATVLFIPSSWGSQLGGHPARIKHNFLAPLPGKKKTSARRVSHAHPLLCFSFPFTLFLLASFLSKTQKISFLYICFYLSAFSFARMGTHEITKLCDFTSTNNSDFICTPIAPPAPAADFYEIKPALLNLVMQEQFYGASTDDAAAHLNNFVELCEMLKYKDVESDIIKLKLFPFSLRGKAKD